ncbi:MAG: hypothetical protein HRO68_07595 [Nitrosopumilus sp.]|nr:hypothetical protein [Nitrosopumilus sp.]
MQLSYNKIKEYDFYKSWNITHDDSRKIFKKCWEEWNQLEPTEFMLSQKTKILSELYYKLDIVTAITPIHKESKNFLKNTKYHITILFFQKTKKNWIMTHS